MTKEPREFGAAFAYIVAAHESNSGQITDEQHQVVVDSIADELGERSIIPGLALLALEAMKLVADKCELTLEDVFALFGSTIAGHER